MRRTNALSLVLALILSSCSAGPAPSASAPSATAPAATVQVSLPMTVLSQPASPTPSATAEPTMAPSATPRPAPPTLTFQVVHAYPHDHGAFTEGLEYHDGWLYEGTGLNGQSTLRRVALESGEVAQTREISATYFGEGITIFGDRIYQLTWQSHVGFIYQQDTFAPLGQFAYPGEGWGLTHDESRLIMSDGTATIRFLDPQTLQQTGAITVTDDQGPVLQLNELEYVDGVIYANIWQTDRIAEISPQTGQVLAWVDLTGLLGAEDRQQSVDVLNGIAYDAAGQRLFVTGKYWPKLFEITLAPAS